MNFEDYNYNMYNQNILVDPKEKLRRQNLHVSSIDSDESNSKLTSTKFGL